MGGGPNNPVLIGDDDMVSLISFAFHLYLSQYSVYPQIWIEADGSMPQALDSQVNALVIKDEPDNDHKVVINLDSDDEKEGVLDGEDVDSEMDEPAMTAHKGELKRELKALGIDPRQK